MREISFDKCYLTLKYIIKYTINCLNEIKINYYYTWEKKGVNKKKEKKRKFNPN